LAEAIGANPTTMLASTPMIENTTSNSMSVNAEARREAWIGENRGCNGWLMAM
jgi:hypothetical protein